MEGLLTMLWNAAFHLEFVLGVKMGWGGMRRNGRLYGRVM